MTDKYKLKTALFRLAQIPLLTLLFLLLGLNLLQFRLSLEALLAEQNRLARTIQIHSDEDLDEVKQQTSAIGSLVPIELAQHNATILFDEFRFRFPYYTTLYFTDPSGIIQATDSDSAALLGLDISGNQFYRRTLDQEEIYVSTPYISVQTGNVTVNVATQVVNQNRLAGLIVAELDLAFIQQTVNALETANHITIFIVDQAGNLVAHPNKQWVNERRNLSTIPFIRDGITGKHDFRLAFDEDSRRWLVGRTTLMDTGWLIVITQPIFEVLQPVLITSGLSLVAFLFVLGVFIWAQYYSAERITRPVAELVRKTDLITQGHYEVLPIEETANIIEINSLSHSFAQMVAAVQEQTQALKTTNADLEVQIEERARAEAALRELNLELEQRVLERTAQLAIANKELAAFSYSVSHDLRAPLRAIDGFSRILAEEAGAALNAEAQDSLRLIHANVVQMNALIEAMLKLSRVTSAQLQQLPVDLSQLALNILRNLHSRQPERVVEWEVMPNLEVIGDPPLLQNLLDNLLNNAWKFTAKNGQARIVFGCQESTRSRIYFVRDNGAGFEMKYAQKLFGAFQRLHSEQEFEGTGVGLATVQRIVARHGGRIWAVGKVGEGATFYFTLWDNQQSDEV